MKFQIGDIINYPRSYIVEIDKDQYHYFSFYENKDFFTIRWKMLKYLIEKNYILYTDIFREENA